MPALPRATGQPEITAAVLIEQIRAYARRPPAESMQANVNRVQGLRHILDAARDELDVAMAVVNSPGPGKVSYRQLETETGLHLYTVRNHVKRGQRMMRGEAA